MEPISPHDVTERHILTVLTGTPLHQVAADIPMRPADLADIVEAYRSAGRAAIEARPGARHWFQLNLQFTNWDAAEQIVAAHLQHLLSGAQEAGLLDNWWFLRKHPCWRLRVHVTPAADPTEARAAIAVALDELTMRGTIERWWESLYEPETLAFGGPSGMTIAHGLFHADSDGILTYLNRPTSTVQAPVVGRRELSLLLCTALLRGARQDHHEQGDVWHHVAHERPLTTEPPTDRLHRMTPNLQRLIDLDTSPTSTLVHPDGPLHFATPWLNAFTTAGSKLADAARNGTLTRGLRAVLANHVIFHWNRLGLPATTQAILARAARDTLMNPTTTPAPRQQ